MINNISNGSIYVWVLLNESIFSFFIIAYVGKVTVARRPLPFGDTVHDEQTVDALKRVWKLAP